METTEENFGCTRRLPAIFLLIMYNIATICMFFIVIKLLFATKKIHYFKKDTSKNSITKNHEKISS